MFSVTIKTTPQQINHRNVEILQQPHQISIYLTPSKNKNTFIHRLIYQHTH